MAIADTPALNRSREVPATTQSGYVMLLVSLALVAAAVWLFIGAVAPDEPDGLGLIGAIITGTLGLLILTGFYMINPNEAAAIQLFGAYKGTDRTEGLRWVLPWLARKKIAVRANNVISEKIKVNDARGNPIEMAAQVVWRVTDTAQALFDVDDYREFVTAQMEAAVRAIGSRYPYDDIEHLEVTCCAASRPKP